MEKMHEAVIAGYLCNLQPYPVRLRILRDREWTGKFPLVPRIVMSAGHFKSIDQREFIVTARKAFTEGKSQKFTCLDGSKCVIVPQEDGIHLKKSKRKKASQDVVLRELLVLSPDPDKRRSALREIMTRIGPTTRKFAEMHDLSKDRELSDAEVADLLSESSRGLVAFKANLNRAFERKGVTLDRIIPDTLDYYDNFCGPNPENNAPDEYLRTLLPTYRKELIKLDLNTGLEISLLGSLHDDLSPGRWTEHVPVDDLWNALNACHPMHDPISLLGALDIAVYRLDDERFRTFGEEAVAKLVQDVFPRPDGIDAYEFISLLSSLVINRISTLEGGSLRAPFWRRMCAWMQASLISRQTTTYSLDLKALKKWVEKQIVLPGGFAQLLDLRREPMFHAGMMTAASFREEIISRLMAMRARHEVEGRRIPKVEEIEDAAKKITSAAFPWSCSLAGPLDGHRRPSDYELRYPTELSKQIVDKSQGDKDIALLSFLAQLSQCFELGDELLKCAGTLVADIRFVNIGERDRLGILERLSDCAMISAAHRDHALATVIGKAIETCAREMASKEEVLAVLQAIILTGAAFEGDEEWARWTEERLTRTAAALPHGEMSAFFLNLLQSLKQVIKLDPCILSRAEALASAAT